MRRHDSIYDEFFDDPLDDVDGFDGFIIETDEPTDPEESWYVANGSDDPFCPMGLGDAEGLCIAALYGCSYVGCDRADNE